MATSTLRRARSDRIGKLITWLLFGVLFTALPFAFKWFEFLGTPSRPAFHWYYLWQHGELLLVSSGFAADAAGEAFSIKDSLSGVRHILGGLCVILVALSAACFAMLQSSSLTYTPLEIDVGSLMLCLSSLSFAVICKSLSD